MEKVYQHLTRKVLRKKCIENLWSISWRQLLSQEQTVKEKMQLDFPIAKKLLHYFICSSFRLFKFFTHFSNNSFTMLPSYIYYFYFNYLINMLYRLLYILSSLLYVTLILLSSIAATLKQKSIHYLFKLISISSIIIQLYWVLSHP